MPSSLGPAEIIVILVVALIVLGPKRLPEAGRQVGKALSEIRRWTQDMKSEVTSAFDADQVRVSTPSAPVTAPDVAVPAPSAPAEVTPVTPSVTSLDKPQLHPQIVPPVAEPAPQEADEAEAEKPESPPAL